MSDNYFDDPELTYFEKVTYSLRKPVSAAAKWWEESVFNVANKMHISSNVGYGITCFFAFLPVVVLLGPFVIVSNILIRYMSNRSRFGRTLYYAAQYFHAHLKDTFISAFCDLSSGLSLPEIRIPWWLR